MAKSERDYQTGDKVRLVGGDLKPLPTWYEVASTGKSSVRVFDAASKKTLSVHRTRIAQVIRKETPIGGEEVMTDTVTQNTEAKVETVAAAPVQAKQIKATVTTAKPKKKKEEMPPFDLQAWIKECGGVHLSKKSKFDHPNHKLVSHVCVNETAGFYFTINTYTYPDGTVSLGKKNTGGNKYPLKGHKMTTKDKGGNPKPSKGSKTAAEKIANFEKDGYKRD